jgi:hypothetical protein
MPLIQYVNLQTLYNYSMFAMKVDKRTSYGLSYIAALMRNMN